MLNYHNICKMLNNCIKAVNKINATNYEAPSFDCRKIYIKTRLHNNNILKSN